MSNVIPSNVVAAYRARRAMLAVEPKVDPKEGYRHIADLVREVIIGIADTTIENWRRSNG